MSKFWHHFITDGGRQCVDAYLGIHGRRVQVAAMRAGLPGTHAVEVRSVVPLSPAEEAGILEGDLLIELAGKATRSVDDLHDLLAELPAGVLLPVRLVRRGQNLERWVALTQA
jgi:serine protease Do